MKKLNIRECSDLDYEGMVVDICVDDGRLVTLSCDEGIDKAKINIFDGVHEQSSWELNYFDFIEALKRSFDLLKELNMNEEN